MTGKKTPARDRLVSPGIILSSDTHVGSSSTIPAVDVPASPARPEALVEGRQVGNGTEME